MESGIHSQVEPEKSAKGTAIASQMPCPKLGSKYWSEGAELKKSKLYKAYNGTDCPPYREFDGTITVGSKTYNHLVPVGGTGGSEAREGREAGSQLNGRSPHPTSPA